MLIQLFERSGYDLATHAETKTGNNPVVISDEGLTEAANEDLSLGRRPCAIFMRAAGDKDSLSLIAVLDLLKKGGDVRVLINQQRLYPKTLQIIYRKLLFYLGILEGIIVGIGYVGALLENAVVIARLTMQAHSHTAQDVVEVRVCEAEAQKQEHLCHEVTA